jgi:hypothetical protein
MVNAWLRERESELIPERGMKKLGYVFKYTRKRSAYNRVAGFALLQLCVLGAAPTS